MAISNLEKKLGAQASILKYGEATADGDVIDIISQSAASLQKAHPSILPSSPILVASTTSQAGNGTSAPGFSYLSSGSHPSPHPPPFSMMQWKPKEPPCFYGRGTEDVHMWTSLVHHYLTFMGGSDAQQVAYSVTLLCDATHEWYMGYERRHRQTAQRLGTADIFDARVIRIQYLIAGGPEPVDVYLTRATTCEGVCLLV